MCSIQQKIYDVISEDISAWRWTEMDERSLDYEAQLGEELGLSPTEASFLHVITSDRPAQAAEIIDQASDAECLLSPVEWIRECKKSLLRRSRSV